MDKSVHRSGNKCRAFRLGTKFLIKLNEFEAEQGVAIVGHRFEPFRDSDTPTEKLVFEDASGRVLRQRLVRVDTIEALLKELEPSLFASGKKKTKWNPESFDKEAVNKKLARRRAVCSGIG